MACPRDLLHAPHFPSCQPDLDPARVEGGGREDVLHDAAGTFPGPLVVLLRDGHPQPWRDVFAVLTVHARISFTLQAEGAAEMLPLAACTLTAAPVWRCAPA